MASDDTERGGDAPGPDVALTDPALTTAELPVVPDAEIAPPFPAVVEPEQPALAAEPGRPAQPEQPAAPEPEQSAVSPAPPVPAPDGPRVIVIGDADAGPAGEHDAPGTPGPAVLKHRGPLVFGDGGGTPSRTLRPGLDEETSRGDAGDDDPRVVVIGDADEKPRDGEIDPRIKARRTQVRRSAGLRRLRAIVAIATLFLLVFGGGTVLRSYVLVVRKVVVTGTAYTPADHLQAATNSVAGRSMVDVSLVELRKLVEASPWVKAVDVTRDWPSTIRIDVLERTPVAYYRGRDDKGYVVDATGVVITTTEAAPADYVEIVGALDPTTPGQPAPDPIRSGALVANALPASLRPLVASIDSQATGVVLKLAGAKSRIVLGSTDDLAAKLVTVLAIQPTCPPGTFDTLDVRVPGKPTVTPATACAAKKKGA